MSITIYKSIDIEDEVRTALASYLTAYCRPLPSNFSVPSIEIRKVGGSEEATIDTATVMLYARAESEYEASDLLRTAVGVLKKICDEQTTDLRFCTVNASGSWTVDPVRPELAMCSATLLVRVHQTTTEVNENE